MNTNYLALARVVSQHSNFKIPMGAVIVKHGHPCAVGYNYVTSHPKWCYGAQATIHAEIDALATASKINLCGSTIYVYREHRDGTSALARPCANCRTMLKSRGVKWMIYTVDEFPHFAKERI